MDGWGEKEKEMFARSCVGFRWSGGRALPASARRLRRYKAAASERRRERWLSGLAAAGRSDRIGAIPCEQRAGADQGRGKDLAQERFPTSRHPAPPIRTVFY